MTDLSDKAVDIKGKAYILVKDRILAFNADYPNGAIETKLHSYVDGHVIVQACVTPDVAKPQRFFTGWSQAKENDGYINKTAALENCESSAVGRALAMMGIGVIDSIASVDEINKATRPVGRPPKVTPAEVLSEGNKEPLPWEEQQEEATAAVERKLNITPDEAKFIEDQTGGAEESHACPQCGAPQELREGIGKESGKPYKGWFCTSGAFDHKPTFVK